MALPKLLPVPWRTDALFQYGYASCKPTYNHLVDMASVVNLSLQNNSKFENLNGNVSAVPQMLP